MKFESYKRAWKVEKTGVYFKNSVILTVSTFIMAAIVVTEIFKFE